MIEQRQSLAILYPADERDPTASFDFALRIEAAISKLDTPFFERSVVRSIDQVQRDQRRVISRDTLYGKTGLPWLKKHETNLVKRENIRTKQLRSLAATAVILADASFDENGNPTLHRTTKSDLSIIKGLQTTGLYTTVILPRKVDEYALKPKRQRALGVIKPVQFEAVFDHSLQEMGVELPQPVGQIENTRERV
jgi:hypothetical protein